MSTHPNPTGRYTLEIFFAPLPGGSLATWDRIASDVAHITIPLSPDEKAFAGQLARSLRSARFAIIAYAAGLAK